MGKSTVSGMVLIVLLLSVLTVAFDVQPVGAQTREVGVQVGDWAKYGVTHNNTTNDPDYRFRFVDSRYFKTEVLSVSGANISFRATTYFENGTEMSDVMWMDISSSRAPPPFFFRAILFVANNLTVGDPLFPNLMSSLVNATSMRTYAGAEREVNFVKWRSTSSMRRASLPKEEYIDDYTTCMFWDRATGVLVEANDTLIHYRIELDMGYHPVPGGYTYVTETFTQMVMEETNMWRTPSLPFWLEWWFCVAVAVVVVSLGGVVYLLRKRKPRVVAPLPSEGSDNISSIGNSGCSSHHALMI